MNAIRLWSTSLVFGLLIASPVHGADLPVKAPVSIPVATVQPIWAGFYIGAHAGWAGIEEVRTEVFDPSGGFASGFRFCCDRSGFIGGAQAGYNWQSANWVWGIEADWSWTNTHRQVVSLSTINGETRTSFADDKWHATAAARVGYAFDHWLLYVKGGAGFLNADRGATLTNVPLTGTVVAGTRNDTFIGWLVGVGAEYALSANWSTKVEFSYTDFGTNQKNFNVPAPLPPAVEKFDTQVYMAKFGVNYRFAGGPLR